MNCIICGGKCDEFDRVDENKCCNGPDVCYPGPSGSLVLYVRCSSCGFVFAPEFQSWSPNDFRARIYNSEYAAVDHEFDSIRPVRSSQTFLALFRNPPERHMDYGGGNGRMSAELKSRGWNSTSFDPFHGTSSRPDGRFSLITAIEVMEHVPNPVATVREMAGYLKPGGTIVFTTQPVEALSECRSGRLRNCWYASPRNGHICIYSIKSLELLASMHGMRYRPFNGMHAFVKEQASAQQDDVMRVRHSGAIGDIIYAIPFLKTLGRRIVMVVGENTFVGGVGMTSKEVSERALAGINKRYPANKLAIAPEGYGNFQALRRLLLAQPWCADVEPSVRSTFFDFNCDTWRADGYKKHLADCVLDHYAARADWRNEPQLVVPRPAINRHAQSLVCCRSHRYRLPGYGPKVATMIAAKAGALGLSPVFIGLESEHKDFVKEVMDVPHVQTEDMLDVANIVAAAPFGVYNASAPLALAAMLRRPRAIECIGEPAAATVVSNAKTEELF